MTQHYDKWITKDFNVLEETQFGWHALGNWLNPWKYFEQVVKMN